MKRFIRWLVRPFVKWLGTDEIMFGFGECHGDCPHKGPHVTFRFVDAMGLEYYWSRHPEQVRDNAWQMIHAADAVEREAESREW